MSSLPPPTARPRATPTRVAVWVLVAGAGIALFVIGLVGIIAKG